MIRTLDPGDAAALHQLHERASDESVRLRFFSLARRTAHTYVEHVLDSPGTLALVAEVHGQMVGLATAKPIDDRSSEVAFLVDDELRGQGLGTLLLEHLAALARDRGIRRFEAEVLPENPACWKCSGTRGSGSTAGSTPAFRCWRWRPTSRRRVQEAADLREFTAEARSLAPMLAPQSVAVYGVRRDGTGIGATVLRAIREGGYQGRPGRTPPLGG